MDTTAGDVLWPLPTLLLPNGMGARYGKEGGAILWLNMRSLKRPYSSFYFIPLSSPIVLQRVYVCSTHCTFPNVLTYSNLIHRWYLLFRSIVRQNYYYRSPERHALGDGAKRALFRAENFLRATFHLPLSPSWRDETRRQVYLSSSPALVSSQLMGGCCHRQFRSRNVLSPANHILP